MTFGVHSIVKNEAPWIAGYLLNLLPFVDQIVLFDGASTDGTLEIVEAIQKEKHGHKIKLYRDKDPKDLQDDYARISNECLWALDTDLAAFFHPDMYVRNPARILDLKDSRAVALTTKMRSFAGEPGGGLCEILEGRGHHWKNIVRLRNPDLGAHYFGHYGAHAEDVYFSAITGDEHRNFAPFFDQYPYEVEDSGLEILHFSDVRTPRRRHERMVRCLMNQGHSHEKALSISLEHPRVTLKDGGGFKFVPSQYPPEMLAAREKYRHLEKESKLVHA